MSEGTSPAQPPVAQPAPTNGNGGTVSKIVDMIRAIGVQAPVVAFVCLTFAGVILGSVYLLKDAISEFPKQNAEAIKEAVKPCHEQQERMNSVIEKNATEWGKHSAIEERMLHVLERFDRRDNKGK